MKISGVKDTIDWYDQNSQTYAEELHKYIPMDSIEAFIKELPDHAYILEAGCGPGRESKVFYEKGLKTIGVDLSEGLLEEARKRNPDVEFIKADFRELPFPDNQFDGVFAHASLVHLESIGDVEKSLKEFLRVLKPNGIVFIKVKAQSGDEETAIVSDSLSKHDRFFRYYTLKEMINHLLNVGFEIITHTIREDGHGRSEIKWLEIIGRKPK